MNGKGINPDIYTYHHFIRYVLDENRKCYTPTLIPYDTLNDKEKKTVDRMFKGNYQLPERYYNGIIKTNGKIILD